MVGIKLLDDVHMTPPMTAAEASAKTERTIFGDNTTSSIHDVAFKKYCGKTLTVRDKQVLRDKPRRVEKSRDVIQLHFEKRFSHLFALAALCYRTDYTFSEGHTIHQGLEAHRILIEPKRGAIKEEAVTFAGAHHATVPCLYAKRPNSDLEFVFVYRSGIYDEGQATANVIVEINQADSAIDGKKTEDKLRTKTVALLNRASRGELTPVEVAQKFGRRLIKEIDRALATPTLSPTVRQVLGIYRDHAVYLAPLPTRPEVVDRWLNLQLDACMQLQSDQLIARLQEDADVPREEIIRLIKRKIDDLPVQIRQESMRRENEHNTPSHFHDLYLHQVLRRLPSGPERELLEEVVGVSFATLVQRMETFQRCEKTRRVLTNNSSAINRLVREIRPLVQRLLGEQIEIKEEQGISPTKKVALRPNLYRLRYRMIQADQAAQSKVKSSIERALNRIRTTSSAPFISDFFYHSLLQRCANAAERTLFSKLLNKSSYSLAQKVRELKVSSAIHRHIDSKTSHINETVKRIIQLSKQPRVTAAIRRQVADNLKSHFPTLHANPRKQIDWALVLRRLYDPLDPGPAKQLTNAIFNTTMRGLDAQITTAQQNRKKPLTADAHVSRHIHEIDTALQTSRVVIRKLKTATDQFRGKLLAELRKLHGYKQAKVIAIYQELYPDAKMCAGTMSQLETAKNKINTTRAEQLARIFDVSQSLFFPGHFAD